MDASTLILVGLIAMALLFDFTNGFHDSANSVATVVATRVLRPRLAVGWAALFNFVAFLVVGTAVANTIGQTVVAGHFNSVVMFSALLGAITWNYLSWHLGLPTSSSHALVGSLVGAGLAEGGPAAIQPSSVAKTALFIVLSPIAGMVIGALVMALLRLLFARANVERTERGFRWAQLVSSAAVSLGHGGNDAQKTMGVIAALLVSTGHLTASGDQLPVPLWVGLLAATGIALGTLSGGWRIVRTMGLHITELRPVSGFSAEAGAALALFGSTAVGAPVSTTHTVAGAITGVGTTNRGTTVNWGVFGRMAMAWLVTMPVAGLVAAATYALSTLPNRTASVVIMSVVVVGLVSVLVVAVRRAPTATDVERDLERADVQIPLRAGTGTLIEAGAPAGDTAGEGTVPAQRNVVRSGAGRRGDRREGRR
jgi:PiT family inorganic phosphate transporter